VLRRAGIALGSIVMLGLSVGEMEVGPELSAVLSSGVSVQVVTSVNVVDEKRLFEATYEADAIDLSFVFDDLKSLFSFVYPVALEARATTLAIVAISNEMMAVCLWEQPHSGAEPTRCWSDAT